MSASLRDSWYRRLSRHQASPLRACGYRSSCSCHRSVHRWSQPVDIKAQCCSASVLKNRRVVFNIKGNDYRLIVAIAYKLQIVYVKFVGTHKEYDAV